MIYELDGNSKKDFTDLIDGNRNLVLTIITMLNNSQNIEEIQGSLSALSVITWESKSLQSFQVHEADILNTLERIFKLRFKNADILYYYTLVINCIALHDPNLEKITEKLTGNLTSILEFCLTVISNLSIKQQIYDTFIKTCEKLTKVFYFLIEKREFKTFFVDKNKMDVFIYIYGMIDNNRLKNDILRLLTNLVNKELNLRENYNVNNLMIIYKDLIRIVDTEDRCYELLESVLGIINVFHQHKIFYKILREQGVIELLEKMKKKPIFQNDMFNKHADIIIEDINAKIKEEEPRPIPQ